MKEDVDAVAVLCDQDGAPVGEIQIVFFQKEQIKVNNTPLSGRTWLFGMLEERTTEKLF